MMTLTHRALLAVWTIVMVTVPALALQQPQTEFVPVDKLPPADQLPAAPLLIAAYAFVWIALMAYLWSIWRRLTKVEADIHALDRRSPQRGGAR